MRTLSRSKSILDRGPGAHDPDFPLLETEDLPADGDWGLMKSLVPDQDDVDNIESGIEELTILSSELD